MTENHFIEALKELNLDKPQFTIIGSKESIAELEEKIAKEIMKQLEDIKLKNAVNIMQDNITFEEMFNQIQKEIDNKRYPIVTNNLYKSKYKNSIYQLDNIYRAEQVTWDNIEAVFRLLKIDNYYKYYNDVISSLTRSGKFVLNKDKVYNNFTSLLIELGDYIVEIEEGSYWAYNEYYFNELFELVPVDITTGSDLDIDPCSNESSLGKMTYTIDPKEHIRKQLILSLQTLVDIKEQLDEIDWDIVYDILEENE